MGVLRLGFRAGFDIFWRRVAGRFGVHRQSSYWI